MYNIYTYEVVFMLDDALEHNSLGHDNWIIDGYNQR